MYGLACAASAMRDVSVEECLDALELNSSYDYDYAVHYFLPSRSPHLLSREDLEALVNIEVRVSVPVPWANANSTIHTGPEFQPASIP